MEKTAAENWISKTYCLWTSKTAKEGLRKHFIREANTSFLPIFAVTMFSRTLLLSFSGEVTGEVYLD